MTNSRPLRGVAHETKNLQQATFKVESALLEELGERLVSSPDVALTELVKNHRHAHREAETAKAHRG